MTVPSTPSEISYLTDGVTDDFPIPFAFDTSADLVAKLTDSVGNVSSFSSFSVSGGNGSTGTLTTNSVLDAGYILTIFDDPEQSQETDYVNNDAFPADAHERALDKQTRLSKRLYQLIRRSLRYADGDPSTNGEIGSVENRKGKYLFFNAVTGAVEYAVALTTTALSQSIIASLLHPQTSAEAAESATPTNHVRTTFPFYDVARHSFLPGSSASANSAALQKVIDVAEEAGGGTVWIPEGSYNFTGGINLKQGVSIIGAGPFATVLTCTTANVHGFQASSALSGITLSDFQLLGTNVTDTDEDGIHIVGHSSSGFPKLRLSNLLVKQWGNIGVYLENCFGALVDAVNASSNKAGGFKFVACFAMEARLIQGFQNTGPGAYVQRAAGSFFSGIMQENTLEGWRVETAEGCTFATYVEQNGDAGSAATTAQFRLTQASGGFNVSSGNKVNIFALGGKGTATSSGYGVYVDFAEGNEINGSLGGHDTNDIILTSNSARNELGTVKYLTGLASDTTTPLVNNGANSIPPKVSHTNATAGTGNVGAGEDDLMTYSLPANSLLLNQQAIEIIAWGNTGNNVNNKRVKLYFGSTVLIDTTAVAAQSKDWELRAIVVRLSNTSQQGITRGNFNGAALASDFTAPAETLSGAVTIKVTGEATADNDVVQRGLIVRGL